MTQGCPPQVRRTPIVLAARHFVQALKLSYLVTLNGPQQPPPPWALKIRRLFKRGLTHLGDYLIKYIIIFFNSKIITYSFSMTHFKK